MDTCAGWEPRTHISIDKKALLRLLVAELDSASAGNDNSRRTETQSSMNTLSNTWNSGVRVDNFNFGAQRLAQTKCAGPITCWKFTCTALKVRLEGFFIDGNTRLRTKRESSEGTSELTY
ncbi:hypothetical protein M514_02062, partial [Trichuris suis]